MLIKQNRIREAHEALHDYYTEKKITEGQHRAIRNLRDTLASYVLELDRALETIEAPCSGDAHENPYIDNCMLCAPFWGVVLKSEYRKRGL